MSWTVIARLLRADGSTETRYARTFGTRVEALLHKDIMDAAWAAPHLDIVVERGGPFRYIVVPCLVCGGDIEAHDHGTICADCARWAVAVEAVANKRRARRGSGCAVEIAAQQERRSRI
jgi:hypothetical protein